jgi:hypothetical protein
MSNELATMHAIRAEAYELARVQFGLESFSVAREGKKTTAIRSELGVAMSGNTAERAEYAGHVALKMWASSKFGVVASELIRVFPTLEKEIATRNASVNAIIASQPEFADKLRLINAARPGKQDVMAMFSIAQGLKGADKGEKAKLLAAGEQINKYELFAELTVCELEAAAKELADAAQEQN